MTSNIYQAKSLWAWDWSIQPDVLLHAYLWPLAVFCNSFIWLTSWDCLPQIGAGANLWQSCRARPLLWIYHALRLAFSTAAVRGQGEGPIEFQFRFSDCILSKICYHFTTTKGIGRAPMPQWIRGSHESQKYFWSGFTNPAGRFSVSFAQKLRCSSVTDFLRICSFVAPCLRAKSTRNRPLRIYETTSWHCRVSICCRESPGTDHYECDSAAGRPWWVLLRQNFRRRLSPRRRNSQLARREI